MFRYYNLKSLYQREQQARDFSLHICLSMGDRGITLIVFEVVSVFHLRRKPDQRKDSVIPGGMVRVRACAIQRHQTGIQNRIMQSF